MAEILRPRSMGELFSQTFHLVFGNLPSLMAIQAIFWVPVEALDYLVASTLKDATVRVDLSGGVVLDNQALAGGAEFAIAVFAGLIVHPIMSAASMLVISDRFMGRRTSLGGALRIALRRFGALIAVGLVVNVCAATVLGFGLGALALSAYGGSPAGALVGLLVSLGCTVLVFWIQVTFSVAAPAVVLENIGTGAALGRSRRLTRGFRFRIFLLMVAIGLVFFGIAAGIGVLTEANPALDEGERMAQWAVRTIASMLYSMLFCVTIVVVYFDLRVRKDGFDLDNLAELVDVIAHRAGIPGEGE